MTTVLFDMMTRILGFCVTAATPNSHRHRGLLGSELSTSKPLASVGAFFEDLEAPKSIIDPPSLSKGCSTVHSPGQRRPDLAETINKLTMLHSIPIFANKHPEQRSLPPANPALSTHTVLIVAATSLREIETLESSAADPREHVRQRSLITLQHLSDDLRCQLSIPVYVLIVLDGIFVSDLSQTSEEDEWRYGADLESLARGLGLSSVQFRYAWDIGGQHVEYAEGEQREYLLHHASWLRREVCDTIKEFGVQIGTFEERRKALLELVAATVGDGVVLDYRSDESRGRSAT